MKTRLHRDCTASYFNPLTRAVERTRTVPPQEVMRALDPETRVMLILHLGERGDFIYILRSALALPRIPWKDLDANGADIVAIAVDAYQMNDMVLYRRARAYLRREGMEWPSWAITRY